MKLYGLTKQTMKRYRMLIPYGLKHDVAMKKLKALYEYNKAFALGIKSCS